MKGIENGPESSQPIGNGARVHAFRHKADSSRGGFSRAPKGGKIRKAVGQGDVSVEAIGGQIVLNFRNGTTGARAKIDDLAMAGRAQRLNKKRRHQSVEAKGCLHEAKVIRREISNDPRKPGLVFQFEEMEPGKHHRNATNLFP